ncbi:hypothetical protein EVAR_54577_1 [Eumeta japonica]|uniref:Uncharacterized protein n=1 Tax=Eumeta variegata TaxID=151549 RepID=A0A4C1YGV9_EUMVA|nr:hypothetical protein EVAR_54577_1 [Eumeta japonica]
MLRSTRVQRVNEPALPMKYHTLIEYRREITAFVVAFCSLNGISSDPLRPSLIPPPSPDFPITRVDLSKRQERKFDTYLMWYSVFTSARNFTFSTKTETKNHHSHADRRSLGSDRTELKKIVWRAIAIPVTKHQVLSNESMVSGGNSEGPPKPRARSSAREALKRTDIAGCLCVSAAAAALPDIDLDAPHKAGRCTKYCVDYELEVKIPSQS